MSYPTVLIDTGLLVAFYDAADRHHEAAIAFFSTCTSQFITTVGCVTETMWLLASDWRVQQEFLNHLSNGIYVCEPLLPEDFSRIAELNAQSFSVLGDFPDLALVVISERLNIAAIATLDPDFDIYRRYRKHPFDRVFRP